MHLYDVKVHECLNLSCMDDYFLAFNLHGLILCGNHLPMLINIEQLTALSIFAIVNNLN
jgi:hypothetical protein